MVQCSWQDLIFVSTFLKGEKDISRLYELSFWCVSILCFLLRKSFRGFNRIEEKTHLKNELWPSVRNTQNVNICRILVSITDGKQGLYKNITCKNFYLYHRERSRFPYNWIKNHIIFIIEKDPVYSLYDRIFSKREGFRSYKENIVSSNVHDREKLIGNFQTWVTITRL